MKRIEFLKKLFFEYEHYFEKNDIDLEGKLKDYESELSEDLDFAKLYDWYKQSWTYRKEPPPPQWLGRYSLKCKKEEEYRPNEYTLEAQRRRKEQEENSEEILRTANKLFSCCEKIWPAYRVKRQARTNHAAN